MNGLQSKPSSSPPTQFQAQQYQRTHTPHTRGPTPPQYYLGAQEADPQGTQFTGISFQTPFQYSNITSQLVPQFGYAQDLSKQAYTAPRMPAGGNPSQAAMSMYQSSTSVRQQQYYNQSSMRPSGYQMSQPQPSQALYTQQQIMFMPPPQFSSSAPQVIMPMTATNYPQRMSSPAYQNSMPTTQQGLFQLPQQNTTNFAPHAHTHTYNNPPAVFYNAAQQQNRPPSASGMSGPGQPVAKKRERTVLQIIDPNSGKDIMEEVQQARGTPPSSGSLASHGTVSGQEISHLPQNEIAAQFAAQVAQVALSTRPGGNQQRTLSDGNLPQHPSPVNVMAAPQQSPSPQVRVDKPPSVVNNASESMAANVQQMPLAYVDMNFHEHQEDSCGPELYSVETPFSPVESDVQVVDLLLPSSSSVQMDDHQLPTAHTNLNSQPPSYSTLEPNVKSDFSCHDSIPQDMVREGSSEHVGLQEQPKLVDSSIKTGLSSVGSKAVSITVSLESSQKTRTSEEPVSEIKTPAVAEQSDISSGERDETLERKLEKQTQQAKPTTGEKTPAAAGQKDTSSVPREVTLEKKPEKQPQPVKPTTADDQPVLSEVVPNESRPDVSSKARVLEVAPEPLAVHTASTPYITESSAKDIKKDIRGKKKAKDINRKGETRQGSEMDAFMDLPTETEAALPVVEKENKDPTEGTKNQDKVVATETNPPPPIVNEEVVDTVDITIENVDSSDVSVAVENEKNEKLKLKYKYKEDQWSPINHEGKKQYDRDFLLQLQNAPESTLKPLDLPDIPDIIIEKPSLRPANRDFAEGSSFVDFTPRYVWSGGPNRSGGVPRRASGQRVRGGPGGSATQAKHINLSIQKDIELHHAKEAWKPGHRAEKIEQGEVDIKSEELFKKVRSILNKLTPQKFQTLVAKMQALEIDTEARLKSVIDLVFEKAISEPGFSVAYANMCRCLSMFKVPAESKQGDVNFRALLLTRCQREFEKANSSEKEFDSKRKEIEKATTEEQKQQMKEELEDEETKAKRRSLGNIRFIGELFKLKMLTENIMHDCVFKLLRTKDEENLECLCRLLKTIGKELETDKAKPRMDQYFAQMQKIVNEKKLSSRVRFMLQDVIELRQGKWVPRRDDNNPKTIDQIHREVAQEAQDRAIFVQTLPQAKPQKGSRGRPGQPSGPMGGGTDGWNTVSRAPLRTDRTIDPTKLKLSKLGDSENIQLGPGGGAARLGWFKGSTGGGARSQEGERPNAPGNRFSALSKADKSEDDGGRRGGGRGFGRPGPPANRPSQELEREKALTAAKTIVAQRPSEERSGGREPERAKTVEKPSTPVQELTEDQILSKTRAIMDEYLHIQDVGEAISCVQELSSSGSLHLFVYNALNQVLERSEVARRQTGLLLHDLVKNNILLVDTYVKGLNEILMFAEDMEIDIPKIWEYLGQLIGPMVQDGSVPLGFLKQVCEPLKANGKSGILVAEILHDASHREGHKKVGRLWAESGLHWSDFVPKNQIDKFLAEKKLEFTKGGNSAPTSPTASIAIPKIEESLNDLITNKGCSNEEVFDWIEGEVDELTVKQEYFIRALMTAVCKSAVTVSSNNLMKVDKSQIQRRNNLLQKYLDHQANFELQALFALQALVHKLEHPPGVLRELFDILYDEDIISEDAFIQWEKSEDPREQEGKGVAMKQVVQFFTWLKEAEDDGES